MLGGGGDDANAEEGRVRYDAMMKATITNRRLGGDIVDWRRGLLVLLLEEVALLLHFAIGDVVFIKNR